MRVLALLLLSVPLVAAQEQGHKAEEPNEPSILWKWANFAIFGGAIGYLLVSKAGPYFRSRTEQVQGALREAAKLREEAEAKAAAIEKRVANLSAESESMRESAREEMKAEAERIREETVRILARIQVQAEQEIASASKLAKDQLRSYSAELAVSLAADQIRERLTPDLQEGLVRNFATGLGSGPARLRQ